MSEPIEEGTVLGGRYRITGLVTSNDDQDLVLTGMDQVLNRQVSILVASNAHATQVAESARQIAIGERTSAVQVLDLGMSHGRTYLVANEVSPDQLLELGLPPSATPYVEPFYTDTLGSEIFGESRQSEPQVYEDDDEYYGTLNAGFEGRDKPSFLNRFSERLAQRRTERAAAAGTAGAAAAASSATAPETADGPPVEPHPAEPVLQEPVTDPTAAVSPESVEPAAQLPAPPSRPPASVKPEKAKASPQPVTETAPVQKQAAPDAEPDYEEDGSEPNKLLRLLPLAAIALVVIVGVVIALNGLNGVKTAGEEPGAGQTSASEDPSPSESPVETETAEPTVEPVIESVTRVVPDQPDLNADYDGQLPLIVDGNNATSWNSYTFQTANFGGFANNMALVVKLEEASDVSDVKISQSGGSGGAVEILVSDSPDLADAKKITTTSFTGPEMNIAVSEDGKPAKAQYVIVNVTELPRLQGGTRPFGMRIGEIAVS